MTDTTGPPCEHQVWGADMYPEFAPEPILYESCSAAATHYVDLTDGGSAHLCDEHLVTYADVIQTDEPLSAATIRGYNQGAAEAGLVTLTMRQAAWLMNEEDLPPGLEPRDFLSGEWADEACGDPEYVEDAQRGFIRGWRAMLEAAAEVLQRAMESTL